MRDEARAVGRRLPDPAATARLAVAFALAASVAILATALLFQYAGGHKPCALCHWQRYPYVAAVPLALAGLAWPRGRAAVLVLLALAFATVAGLAFYHVGVEQKWWLGPASCGAAGFPGAQTLEQIKAALLRTPILRCDTPSWSLFGLTMAGYNLALAAALLFISAGAAWRALRSVPAQEAA